MPHDFCFNESLFNLMYIFISIIYIIIKQKVYEFGNILCKLQDQKNFLEKFDN